MDIKNTQSVLPPQVQAQLLDAQRKGPAIRPAPAAADSDGREQERFIADPDATTQAVVQRRPRRADGQGFSSESDLDDARQSVNQALNREAPLGRTSVRIESERQIEPGQILDISV